MEIIILTVLTVILIVLIIIGLSLNMDSLAASSIISLVVLGFFGWLVFGVSYTKETKIKHTEPCSITHTRRVVIVDDCVKIHTFEMKVDFDNITDSTKFYYEVDYNIYGGIINKKLKYIN
jgi:hypothetical protein